MKKVALAALAAFIGSSGVQAQPQGMPDRVEVDWLALGSEETERAFTLERWQPIDFLEIAPSRLFKLQDKTSDERRKRVSKEGAIFAPVRGRDDILCEPMRALRQINVVCLVDTDRNGTWDSFFRTKPRSEVFQDGQVGTLGKLGEPAVLSEIDPHESGAKLPLKLSYAGIRGGLFTKGRETFSVCYTRWVPALIASGKFVSSCLPSLAMFDGPVPQRVTVFGRNLVIEAADEKTATMRIIAPSEDVPL